MLKLAKVTWKAFTLVQNIYIFQINAIILNILLINKTWKKIIMVFTKLLNNTVFRIDKNWEIITKSAYSNDFWRIIWHLRLD